MGNIHIRRMKVFVVAVIIYLDYKAVQKFEKFTSMGKRSSLWEQAHERNARRLLKLIINLKGLWVKLGQYLSTRADVLPTAYICLLKQLQDSLPPRSMQEVGRTIIKEMGRPISDIFSDFVEEPLATASIAQVHRATLMNGKQVVVKVQHEDIKFIILEDLKNAKAIVHFIAWAEPQFDLKQMLVEWCKEFPRELDFNHEAENTRSVAYNLCHKAKATGSSLGNGVNVLIPEVIQSTEKVIILEYMDGIRLSDYGSLDAYDIDRQKVVEEITRAYAHQIYVDGFFNGDPHPGNFLVSKDPPHLPILLDFGLTKSISAFMKQALAKMFLACAEGDQVALLSSFSEMGLRLRLDAPDQAMEMTNMFFRASAPAKEASENVRVLASQRLKSLEFLQKKMKLGEKEAKNFNPIDVFPGDAVIFIRVVNLLRGLSSMLNVRVVYLDIMRPFAEAALQGITACRPVSDPSWIFDSPVLSDVEDKVRKLLLEIGNDKILGIQVCAYKDGQVIVDTAAGLRGRYDPRPILPDTLFPVFSATKGVTAGLLHWLVDNRKLKFEDTVSHIWPDFGINGKHALKVHHVLNHTSGLHNALTNAIIDDPLLMCDWNECLNHIARSTPETKPGSQQSYHYLSFGWLCGGIVEHACGQTFQEVLEQAVIHPLGIEGEMYIGIPPGVEARLASISMDAEDMAQLSGMRTQLDFLPGFQQSSIDNIISRFPYVFNMLPVRRAIVPAANGHCSARALARFYAALASGGVIPPHTSSEPLLGSHIHIPEFPSLKCVKKFNSKRVKPALGKTDSIGVQEEGSHGKRVNMCSEDSKNSLVVVQDRIFKNCQIHDAILGLGDYQDFVLPGGQFGLGFGVFRSIDGSLTCFGHSGIGGSTGFCDIQQNFAMSVTVNKIPLGDVTRKIVQLVCSEVGVPLPEEFSPSGRRP